MLQERLNKGDAHIVVIKIICMFPNVAGDQRRVCSGDRCAGVARIDDIKCAVFFFNQPGPAGTEVTDGALCEGICKGVVAALFGVNLRCDHVCGLTAAVRL